MSRRKKISDLIAYFCEQIGQHPDVTHVDVLEENILIDLAGSGEHIRVQMNVGTIADELLAAVEHGDPYAYLNDLLAATLRDIDKSPDDEEMTSMLAAVAVPHEYIDEDLMLIRRPLLDGLDVALIFDEPTRIAFARPEDLRRIKLDETAAWEQGLRNLTRRAEVWMGGDGMQRCAALVTGDSNDGARGLLRADLVRDIIRDAEISPPWLLAVPSRDLAVVTSGADPRHRLGFTEQCASDYRAAQYPVAGRPILLDDQARPTRMISFDELQ